jgi:hypothetical protein
MKGNDFLYYQIEQLHVPFENPDCPRDWKDWYHYILFDPISSTRLLFNFSLSGNPQTGEIVTTLFVNSLAATGSKEGIGFMDISEWKRAAIRRVPLVVKSPVAEISFVNEETFVEVQSEDKNISLRLTAKPVATPFLIPEFFPFGNGFIGWGFIPGMTVRGSLTLGGTKLEIGSDWYCYHDHNYGRFNWGDDIGWIWWTASLRSEDGKLMSFVFHKGNSRSNKKSGIPYLFIYEDNILKKAFMGNTIRLTMEREPTARIPVIFPGPLASVFIDNHICCVKTISIRGRDDRDDVQIRLQVEEVLQIILPDYQKKQYSYLMEMNGKCSGSYSIKSKKVKGLNGNFYAEYVY